MLFINHQTILFYLIFCLRLFNKFNCDLLGDVFGLGSGSTPNSKSGVGKMFLINLLSGNVQNPRTPDGKPITEGDIVSDPDKRKGVRDDGDLWPNGLIPFIFHASVVEGQRKIIFEAMRHWEENTCIKFRAKTLMDLHYIRFRSDTAGCWSSVGRKFVKIGVGQDISLGVGCSKFFTAVHEIGHAIGFYHEHARTDRDSNVKILWDNVKSGLDIQFEMKDTRNEDVEYDYRSIMHYPAWAFSKSPLVKNTIVSRNPLHQYLIDEEKDTMSFRDAKLTNMLYKCIEQCPNFHITRCQNRGYLSPYRGYGKYCFCMCPPGFYGDLCQYSISVDQSYYGSQKCGGNITTEGIIFTPNYPQRKNEFESCAFWISAPEDHIVSVEFLDFSFCPPYDGEEKPTIQGKCLFESVEIRNTNDIYTGTIYCGEQIKAGTIMKSSEKDFIIIIIADDQMKGRGLKANVRFIQQSSPKNNINRRNNNNVGLLGFNLQQQQQQQQQSAILNNRNNGQQQQVQQQFSLLQGIL